MDTNYYLFSTRYERKIIVLKILFENDSLYRVRVLGYVDIFKTRMDTPMILEGNTHTLLKSQTQYKKYTPEEFYGKLYI